MIEMVYFNTEFTNIILYKSAIAEFVKFVANQKQIYH